MKKIISLILVVIITINFTACSRTNSLNRYSAQFLELFDTITQIVGYTDSKKDFENYSKLIYDELKTYHQLYDIYNNYDGINNIKTINDNAGKAPVKVDKKIIDLLLFAKQKYIDTDGAFNIALGSVLSIWHDYREEGIDNPDKAELPPMELLQKANLHTDINNVIIDGANSTVFLKDKDMSLDVGSVGKGYAVEQVAKYIEGKGLKQALISVGGNIRAIGGKDKDNANWNVGIKNPDEKSENSNLCVVKLKNLSLVTSGDYQRYYTVKGKKYHHIINDHTLMPSEYFTAVTILTADSGNADALSTAVFNMPLDEGMKFINSLDGTEAVWVMKDGTLKYSNNFKTYIKE